MQVLEQFQRVVAERHSYARQWKERSGGKVVGYLCTYVPEEVLYAAGLLADINKIMPVPPALDEKTLAGLGAGLGSSVPGEQLQKAVQSYLEFIVGVIPALYFMSSFFFLALSHLLAIWALGRLGIFSFGPKKFVTWQAPFFLVFMLGAGLAGHLFLENEWVKAADNLLLVVVFAYAICGASNLEYFFKKLRAHWVVRGLFYIWLLLFGLASFFILSAVGFLDSRFDFRGLKKVVLAKESEG